MTENKPAPITFTSIYTGKPEIYKLGREEYITASKCPIDKTTLFSFKGGTGRDVWETQTIYHCPNCGQDYYSLDPARLEHSKKITMEERKKSLAKLRAQESYLIKFLQAAGEKVNFSKKQCVTTL